MEEDRDPSGKLWTLKGGCGSPDTTSDACLKVGVVEAPIEWLLYSEFAVIVAFVHLYTLFMVVPIFNSMLRIDRSLLEAAYDTGASTWQMLTNVIIPLCRPGIIIGSIFVVTIVMGDFLTIGVMGGQQIASVGKIINVEITLSNLWMEFNRSRTGK